MAIISNKTIRILFLGLFLVIPVSGIAGDAPKAKPPEAANVLLITIDTLRFDRVGIHSDRHVRTPHLDALARRSAVFERAFAHTTLTRPSHANILTGTTPLYHGVSDNPGFRLEDRYLTLAEYMKAERYETGAFIGAFVLDRRFGLARGFDHYDDDNGDQDFDAFDFVERPADEVVEPAMEWISARSGKWFCWVHVFDPHDPYTPPEPYKTLYARDPYSGEAAFVDAQLGRLFDFLEKRGDFARTVIVVTSDHGEAFGEKDEIYHGFFAYNNTLHVPLFLFYPGVEAGMVRENASHIDIFPSVCDALDLPVPRHIQGESLLPLIAGKERREKRIYFESLAPQISMQAAPLQGFIRGNMKFIDLPIKEVYDLDTDPLEMRNLASKSDIPKLARDLEDLRKSLRGRGTTQDLSGRNADILPMLRSLGYISGKAVKKKSYGAADDPKSLQPVIAYLRQAVAEFKAGKTDAAIRRINTVLRIRPTYVSAYTSLAFIQYAAGRSDIALSVLKEGLTKVPGNLELMGNLGIIHIMARQYREAIEPLEYCVRSQPYDPDTANYLGRAYMETGDFMRARERFEQALKLDPRMVAARNNLGYLSLILYVRTGDETHYEDALRNFDRALTLKPELEAAVKGKEAALKQKAQFAEAAKAVEKK